MVVSDLPLLTCENEFLLRITTHQFWYYTYCVYVQILIFKNYFFFFLTKKWIIMRFSSSSGGSSIIIFFPGKTHSTSSWGQQTVPSIQVLLWRPLSEVMRVTTSTEWCAAGIGKQKRCFMLLCSFLSSYNTGTKLETLIFTQVEIVSTIN